MGSLNYLPCPQAPVCEVFQDQVLYLSSALREEVGLYRHSRKSF
jgi:hypothetical protein